MMRRWCLPVGRASLIMEGMKRILDAARKNPEILIVVLCFSVIYGIRMFTNHPWYDELYTYYSFISRGPVYAGIHWPLPNSHLGYSALSGFLNYLGNPVIALRGVSFLCALINLFLIYTVGLRMFGKKLWSLIAVFFYAGNFLVHSLSVQGRGYTLSLTFYLMALLSLLRLAEEEKEGEKRRVFYVIFALALPAGIYTVPSSAHWVISVCAVGGMFFLLNKRFREFWKLFISAFIGGILTFIIYGTVWLAIGSNYLSKDPGSEYFGLYQLEVIRRSPFLSLTTGADMMLSTPYIQSIDRKSAVFNMPGYLSNLFDQFYPRQGIPVLVLLGIVLVLGIFMTVKKGARFTDLYFPVTILMLPVVFIVQSVHPYLRVSSWFGAPVALAAAYLVRVIYLFIHDAGPVGKISVDSQSLTCADDSISGESGCSLPAGDPGSCVPGPLGAKRDTLSGAGPASYWNYIIELILLAAVILLVTSSHYRTNVAGRENNIEEALRIYYGQNDRIESIYYTDDYQKYVIKFYFGEEPEEKPMGEAAVVLVPSEFEDPSFPADEMEWPMLTSRGGFDFDLLGKEYEECCRTETYAVYRKKAG